MHSSAAELLIRSRLQVCSNVSDRHEFEIKLGI